LFGDINVQLIIQKARKKFKIFYSILFSVISVPLLNSKTKLTTMKKTVTTKYTDQEFRQLIREELKAILSGEDQQIAPGENEGYITVTQAADFIKMKPGSIRQLIHKKLIPFHKAGGRVLLKKSELSDWISSGKLTNADYKEAIAADLDLGKTKDGAYTGEEQGEE